MHYRGCIQIAANSSYIGDVGRCDISAMAAVVYQTVRTSDYAADAGYTCFGRVYLNCADMMTIGKAGACAWH